MQPEPLRRPSAIDDCIADIGRAMRKVHTDWNKKRARQMLHEPVLLNSAWEGLHRLQPSEGVIACRRLLKDERAAWHRPNLRAALLAYRYRRRAEAAELAEMEAA